MPLSPFFLVVNIFCYGFLRNITDGTVVASVRPQSGSPELLGFYCRKSCKHGDRGLYNLCTLSDGTIVSSKQAVAVKRKYQYLRSKLQQKGTRSAKRHLRKMSGREKRFMSDFNHCVTKQLASRTDVGSYALEDLKGIRNKRKGKKLNSWLSNWSYFQFQQQLKYKCALNGISLVFVDPRYTSQKCSCCGTIDKLSRVKSRYVCTTCGHTEHADVNAAKNIRDNYVRFQAKQGAQPPNRDNTSC